jgi:hypothetical protein
MRSRLAARGNFRPAVVTIRDSLQNGGGKTRTELIPTRIRGRSCSLRARSPIDARPPGAPITIPPGVAPRDRPLRRPSTTRSQLAPPLPPAILCRCAWWPILHQLASGLDQAHDDRAPHWGRTNCDPTRARVPPWPGALLFSSQPARASSKCRKMNCFCVRVTALVILASC